MKRKPTFVLITSHDSSRPPSLPLSPPPPSSPQANSGSGKSAAFVIGTLALIDSEKTCPQAIILAPNRELVLQAWPSLPPALPPALPLLPFVTLSTRRLF